MGEQRTCLCDVRHAHEVLLAKSGVYDHSGDNGKVVIYATVNMRVVL